MLPAGMVITDADGIQVRQLVYGDKRVKVMRPNLLAVTIGNGQVKAGRFGTVMALQ